ncbi:hypothetical protein ACLB2K_026432 [Fragaria x ananassa]
MVSSSSALSRLSSISRHFNPSHASKSIKISPEVSEALSNGRAVVALESTIISHGMPYPKNLETAKEVEAVVRENGAVPATIAILDGTPCVGLTIKELEKLAKLGPRAQKTARRDIAHVVGIPLFVTGGIGGVHQHGENTMDISSDLTELGRTPVAVISAGVKSILDIPRTLEYLVPCRVDTPDDCARLIDANLKLQLGTGMLIAVPIPKEHLASGSLIESAIQTALREARDKNITGNAATPFLLARVNELTGGASLTSNIALVKNNALVGAEIAVALSQIRECCRKGDQSCSGDTLVSKLLYRAKQLGMLMCHRRA